MALKTFVDGEVLTSADVNTYLVNTLYAVKASDESVTSSTTLQDDEHLFASVAANSVYEVTVALRGTANSSGDLKVQFAGPAGATGLFGAGKDHSCVTLGTPNGPISLSTATPDTVFFMGTLTVGGTAGTFKLQWAQNTSNATATTLQAGSYMVLRRIL